VYWAEVYDKSNNQSSATINRLDFGTFETGSTFETVFDQNSGFKRIDSLEIDPFSR
jgi:hypothetical protein